MNTRTGGKANAATTTGEEMVVVVEREKRERGEWDERETKRGASEGACCQWQCEREKGKGGLIFVPQ